MNYIVHWSDVVGDFIDTFSRIAKAEYYANQKHPANSEAMTREAYKHFSDEDKDEYNKKRHYMRNCGYTKDGYVIRWLGWFGVPTLQGETLKFKTTADPDRRKYISLREFLEYKQGQEGVADEDEYYARQDIERETRNVAQGYSMRGFVREL